MAKNMTFKGLAFGAGIALVASGLSAVPASAAGNGLVGYVTLAADGGTHTNVLTTDTLDLKANFSPAVNEVSGRNLKFLVTDPNSTSTADASRTNSDAAANAAVTSIVGDGTTITATGASGAFGASGSYVLYGAVATSGNTAEATALNGLVVARASATTATVADTTSITNANISTKPTAFALAGLSTEAQLENALLPLGGSLESGYGIASTIGGVATTDGRTTTGSYVVTTSIYQAGADVILRLSSDSSLSQTNVVTAWIDTDGDNVIDDTEYASPDVTVKFLAPTDVTPTLTIDPIGINDLSVTARATFSPELNMTQTGDVQVTFTRQGYAETLVASGDNNIENASQVGTTSTWSSTVNMYNSATNDPWTYTVPGSATSSSADSKTGQIATLTTATAHGIVAGDVITVGAGGSAYQGTFVVLSAPTTTTLTYDTGNATADSGTPTFTKTGTAAAAGTYSARVILDAVLVGSAIFQTTGTTSVAALANDVVVASGVASDGAVRVGNTGDVTVTATATKADTTAAASVPVLVTATAVSSAGTILVNGVKAAANGTWNLTTDASGEVNLVVSNSSAKANEAITLQVKTQGQTATTTLTWTAAVYKLYDLNVKDGWLSKRTVEVGGSYTFDLALLDQWKEGPTTGAYQIQVTTDNRTVSSQYVAVSGGRASFTLTDGGIGATMNSNVQMDIEYKAPTATTFSTYASGAYDWDGTNADDSEDEKVVVSVITDQTDAISLDLTGASTLDYKGDGSQALFVSALAAKATIARDGLTTQVARPAYGANAVINGAVKNSVSGVARAGAQVTITGPSDLLFSVGETDQFGSLTTTADGSGYFTFNVYSNKTQTDTVVTMTTPDGASKTQKISFSKPAVTAVKTITIDAPASALPGSTFNMVATLADVFGNGVDLDIAENSGAGNGVTDSGTFVVTYTGPGVNFGTLPVVTDSNGEAKVAILLGSNDSGTATMTVTWDRDGTGTDYAAITASKSVVVGASAVASWTSNQNDGTVKMYAKNVIGAGKVQFMVNGEEIAWVRAASSADPKLRLAGAQGAAYLVRTIDLVEGQKNVLEIYVDGVRTARSAYTY